MIQCGTCASPKIGILDPKSYILNPISYILYPISYILLSYAFSTNRTADKSTGGFRALAPLADRVFAILLVADYRNQPRRCRTERSGLGLWVFEEEPGTH